MSCVIVGFGKVGPALAHAFARKNIDVAVASRRPREALAPQARAIGPTVVAKSLRDALEQTQSSWQFHSGNIARLRSTAKLERQDGHRRDERYRAILALRPP